MAARKRKTADANPGATPSRESFANAVTARKVRAGKPSRSSDAAARATLASESDAQLDDLIRRRLALPVAARMNFLRRRLPGGGSSL